MKANTFYVDFIKKILFGFVVGVACITPGLSAGVIAAAAGLYEPIVHAIVNVRKEFRKSVVYLLPLGIGAVLGILLFSKVMKQLMMNAEFIVLYIFLGLVAGSIPSLVKEANSSGFRKKYLWATVFAFAFVICFERNVTWVPDQTNAAEVNMVTAIISGAILAFGTIVPGISSSFILMRFGMYEIVLSALADINIKILAMTGIGFVVTALAIIKLVDILFSKFRGYAYYAVMGFLVGSMVMIFPGFRTGLDLAIDIFLFVISAAISFITMRLKK
ncbi:MAG TPA: DUF368 domain-containing protein [Clostridiaceae bacterium]|nr:DUF368 domain-containing protein [Clostridiaceae bacterium]